MVSVRTKQLMRGARGLVKSTENKPVVNALREVAAGHIVPDVEGDTIQH
jgi:DNA-directed RNA polymerase subunit K/omega